MNKVTRSRSHCPGYPSQPRSPNIVHEDIGVSKIRYNLSPGILDRKVDRTLYFPDFHVGNTEIGMEPGLREEGEVFLGIGHDLGRVQHISHKKIRNDDKKHRPDGGSDNLSNGHGRSTRGGGELAGTPDPVRENKLEVRHGPSGDLSIYHIDLECFTGIPVIVVVEIGERIGPFSVR